MGTSTSYTGPTGKTPLLPPWADDPDDDPEAAPGDDQDVPPPDDEAAAPPEAATPPEAAPAIEWSVPKAALTRWARGGRSTTLRRVAGTYVAASGGAGRATTGARSGRAATARLGGFLGTGLRDGFAAAARELGLRDVVGRDARFVLATLVDRLAPAGALREEAVARAAMIETLADLFDRHAVEAGGLGALDALDADGVRRILALFVTNYVNARFQQELVSRVERGAVSERAANALLDQIRDFIAGIVRLDLRDIDVVALDWRGPEGRRVVDRVYEAAYSLLGGGV